MKTTDYNTSKKLKELGFEANTNYYYFNKGCLLDYCNNLDEIEYSKPITKAYDLETILEALPKNITYEFIKQDHQQYFRCESDTTRFDIKFIINKKENESLATTAGRLLVKLIQEGLIKLEK